MIWNPTPTEDYPETYTMISADDREYVIQMRFGRYFCFRVYREYATPFLLHTSPTLKSAKRWFDRNIGNID